jgi:hypothetical protein
LNWISKNIWRFFSKRKQFNSMWFINFDLTNILPHFGLDLFSMFNQFWNFFIKIIQQIIEKSSTKKLTIIKIIK